MDGNSSRRGGESPHFAHWMRRRRNTFQVGGRPDLDEAIRRLRAYAEAGADCLYAPGLSAREDIEAVVQAVAPKPVNVMMGHAAKLGFEVLAEIGVRRVSTANALSLAAWSGFVAAAEKLMRGEVDGLGDTVGYAQLCEQFQRYG